MFPIGNMLITPIKFCHKILPMSSSCSKNEYFPDKFKKNWQRASENNIKTNFTLIKQLISKFNITFIGRDAVLPEK